MKRSSIKLRITLWYTVIMMVIAAVALALMFGWSRMILERDITGRLHRTVHNSARMQMTPDGRIHDIPDFMYFENGIHLALYDKDGTLLKGRIPFENVENIGFQEDKTQKRSVNGTVYYIYDKKIKVPNQESIWLRGAISLRGESYMLQSVMKTNVIVTLILILAAAVGGYWMIKRSLKPINLIRKTAKEISESQDLSQRIGITGGKDEIYQLADTFDEMLEKIEQTLEQEKKFTSDASHELRTPVAVILSECEYMQDCAKTEDEFQESAEVIQKQSRRMAKLIGELLTFSRMDSGVQQVQMEAVDLSELLTFVCEEQQEIREELIEMIMEISDHIIIEGDQFLLTRLFVNLISNAYQYGRLQGHIWVTLKEEVDVVTIAVRDDGIGISKNALPHIWKRFYQADPSRTNRENGSMGLGLSMVQWIVQQHKGSITVESELEKGSTFTVTLPKKRNLQK